MGTLPERELAGPADASPSAAQASEKIFAVDDASLSPAEPWPSGFVEVCSAELACSVQQFYQRFWSDESGFEQEFRKVREEDKELQVARWSSHQKLGNARDVSFRSPLKQAFGPKSTYCHQTQRFTLHRGMHLVIQTSQVMTDIPYGDYFRVETRWDVTSRRGSERCAVRVGVDVPFSRSTMLKGQIVSGARDGSRQSCQAWVELAKQTLAREGSALPAVQPVSASQPAIPAVTSVDVDRAIDIDTLEIPDQWRGEIRRMLISKSMQGRSPDSPTTARSQEGSPSAMMSPRRSWHEGGSPRAPDTALGRLQAAVASLTCDPVMLGAVVAGVLAMVAYIFVQVVFSRQGAVPGTESGYWAREVEHLERDLLFLQERTVAVEKLLAVAKSALARSAGEAE